MFKISTIDRKRSETFDEFKTRNVEQNFTKRKNKVNLNKRKVDEKEKIDKRIDMKTNRFNRM